MKKVKISANAKLELFEYDSGLLKDEEVEIDVEYCGLCHSHMSMLKNECGITQYPFVPGYEVIGAVFVVGDRTSTRSFSLYLDSSRRR